MLNIIKSDLYRIIKSSGFIFFIVVMFFMLETTAIHNGCFQLDFRAFIYTDYDYVTTNNILSQIASNNLYYFLMIIPAFVFINTDLSNHSVKNTITSVTDKTKYYFAKFILTELFSIVVLVVSNGLLWGLSMLKGGVAKEIPFTEFAAITLRQLPIFIGFTAILIFAAFTFSKSIIYIAFTLLLQIVWQWVLASAYNINLVISSNDIIEKYVAKYEIQNALITVAISPDSDYTVKCSIIYLTGALILMLWGYMIFKKREI